MDSAAVPNGRGIVEVAGEDARALLQRLITNDVEGLQPGEARYAALLSPQGKIVVDFLVVSDPTPEVSERFLVDCPAGLAPDLARKLTMYKLRAKVNVTDCSPVLGAIALIEDAGVTRSSGLLVYTDPRSPALGQRVIGPHEDLAALLPTDDAIRARRIAAGVPESGVDFGFNDAFPHEANLDRLSGVDFRKGCYVGQEVVSRMQHRGTARKRVAHVTFEGLPPAPGTELKAGDLPVGTMGAAAGHHGLAMIRIDRVAEAVAAGLPIMAGDARLVVTA